MFLVLFSSLNIVHRENGHRVIHEKLTGTALYPGALFDPYEQQYVHSNVIHLIFLRYYSRNERMKQMRLYQHSARCPVGLRTFLDCNPSYWCFIPLRWHDAEHGNLLYMREASNVDPEMTNIIRIGALDNRRVSHYMDYVPLPPAVYAFSYQQRQKQRVFFEHFLSLHDPQRIYINTRLLLSVSTRSRLPHIIILLIVLFPFLAIVPNETSLILRYIIKIFFVIHGETKLNMICPIDGDPEKRYGRPYNLVWCANLNYPSISTTTSTT